MANPKIPDIHTLIQMGFDPKTGLPLKMGGKFDIKLLGDIKRFLRLIDEQDAVNRYVWHNLPANLSSQDLERLLYYKGQLAFFYDKNTNEYYFMPYALDGGIDYYGRYASIHPIPINGGADTKENKILASYLSTLKLKPIYGIKLEEEVDIEDLTKTAVILNDYTPQMGQTIIPRQVINDPIIEAMAECIPMMRTNLLTHTGVKGMRVNDADQKDEVMSANHQMYYAAMTGQRFTPIVGTTEFQDLESGSGVGKVDEYMIAMRALDNLRLSGYGIDNGGLFEKKAHNLEGEIQINNASVGIVYQDGLSGRQNFCNIVNSIHDLGIWCEASEDIVNADLNGDGLAYDRNENGENSGITGGNSNGSDTEVQE